MVWTSLLPLLFAADAETEAAKLLRIAYASQYEWREDAVEDATLEFRFKVKRKSPQVGTEEYDGRAHAVAVGSGIVRRHYRGLAKNRRDEIDRHLDWVFGRFVRKPFEEEFKDAKLSGPEDGSDGRKTVTVGNTAYHLKSDRIVGTEFRLSDSGPWIAVTLTVADMRGGYAILGERYSLAAGEGSAETERSLQLFTETEPPAPLRYVYTTKKPAGEEEITLDFSPAKFNQPNPVDLDPRARDELKQAWGRRYALPETFRCAGGFLRKADARSWSLVPERCEGDFRVSGPGTVEAFVDNLRLRWQDPSAINRIVTEDFVWVFGLLRAQTFEQAFPGCGFELMPVSRAVVVHVFGDPRVLAFRLEDGRIVAHLENTADEESWWEHRTRKLPDGHELLEKMSRRIGDKLYEQEIQYGKVKGFYLPKAFTRFSPAFGPYSQRPGVDEYELKNVKVLP